MRVKINKQKCFLFVFGAWLMTKLWWTFEMSRLAFYRAMPGKKINHIVYTASLPPASEWSYEDDRLSVLNYDDDSRAFIIYKLPGMSKN